MSQTYIIDLLGISGLGVLVIMYFYALFWNKQSPGRVKRIKRVIKMFNEPTPSWWLWGDKLWLNWQRANFAGMVSTTFLTVSFLYNTISNLFKVEDQLWNEIIFYALVTFWAITGILFLLVFFAGKPQKLIFRYMRKDFDGKNPEDLF